MIPELGHYALMLAAAGAHSTLLLAVQPDDPAVESGARSPNALCHRTRMVAIHNSNDDLVARSWRFI